MARTRRRAPLVTHDQPSGSISRDGLGLRVVEAWLPGPGAKNPMSKGNHMQRMKRGSRVHSVHSDALMAYQQELVDLARRVGPDVPLQGPVALHVVFVRRIPKGWSEAKRQAAVEGRVHVTCKPDRGNLLKLIEDALEKAGWYVDDAQVVDGRVAKSWGEEPGYRILMRELWSDERERGGGS